MNNKVLFIIGLILIVVGLVKPNLNIGFPVRPNDVVITAPADEAVRKAAEEVTALFLSKSGSKKEAAELRDLYCGLSRLVKLDGSDQVIKTTEEVRQANSLAGVLLHLDIKGKYPGLAQESHEVVVTAIGDDVVSLTPDLRTKGADAFMALAWAYDQIVK